MQIWLSVPVKASLRSWEVSKLKIKSSQASSTLISLQRLDPASVQEIHISLLGSMNLCEKSILKQADTGNDKTEKGRVLALKELSTSSSEKPQGPMLIYH